MKVNMFVFVDMALYYILWPCRCFAVIDRPKINKNSIYDIHPSNEIPNGVHRDITAAINHPFLQAWVIELVFLYIYTPDRNFTFSHELSYEIYSDFICTLVYICRLYTYVKYFLRRRGL